MAVEPKKAMANSTASKFFCYILYNEKNTLTYVGITNNIPRRIRQHNTEIEGGAIYTTRMVRKHGVSWKYLCAFTFDENIPFDRNSAMSVEWHLKFLARTKKGYRSHIGRLQSIPAVLNMKKVAMYGQKPIVYVQETFLPAAVQVLQGFEVKPLSEIYNAPSVPSAPLDVTELETFVEKSVGDVNTPVLQDA